MTDTGTAPVRTAATDAPAYQWYAAGQWRDAPESRRFDDFEPYTGHLFARVPDCGPEEAKIAIAAANDAFPAWAGTPPAEKARLFVRAAEIVRRRRGEIHAPMGGVRDSWWGRTGPDSLADFTDIIWINTTSSERHFPF